jgi:hypothetical protein
MRGRLRAMVAGQTVDGDMGKVDANLGRFRDNACKCFSDRCFAENGRVIFTAPTEVIVTTLSHPVDHVRLGSERGA